MGKGNVCVTGDYEGLYYVDFDNFTCYREDQDGNPVKDQYGHPVHDYELEQVYLEDAISEFINDFSLLFKSFLPCDIWLNRTSKAIMENELFYIAIEDNEWSEAFMLLQKEQSCYSCGRIENLQSRHYSTYLEGMKHCLFEQFDELGVYTGPWTSGRITRTAEQPKNKLKEKERRFKE